MPRAHASGRAWLTRADGRPIHFPRPMSLVQLFNVLWRRQRLTFLLVFASVMVAAVVVIASMEKQYEATATLFVGENRPISTGADAVQLDEVLASTYAELLDSSNVAGAVIAELPFKPTKTELEDQISFEVITGTRLIRISALSESPAQAQVLANTYANTFVTSQQTAARESGETQLAELKTRIADLARQAATLEGETGVDAEAQRAAALSELDAARASYSATQENITLEGSNVSVASGADRPTGPARPRPKLYTAIAACLALLLATGAALLRNAFDRRVTDEDELQEIVGAPILSRIPVARSSKEAEHLREEAYQFLRANLQFAHPGGKNGEAIAVTSAVAGEGKSTIVAGLTRVLGESPPDVVAVDCDLRRPMLSRNFDCQGEPGVTNVLSQGLDPEDLLVEKSELNGWLLPSGPIPPNPAVLTTLPAFAEMLDQLRLRADFVMVDTPPVTAVADASGVTSRVDSVLLVVDMGVARRDILREAVKQLNKSSARVIGIVINKARLGMDDYYYSYYRADGGDAEPARVRANEADGGKQPTARA